MCEGRITAEECQKVLNTFPSAKTPGNDGKIDLKKFNMVQYADDLTAFVSDIRSVLLVVSFLLQ